MLLLSLGLLVFLGVHSIRIFAADWRATQIERHGEAAWKGGYSLLSLAGLVMIGLGYGAARIGQPDLWPPPVWVRHLTFLITLAAFVLLVAAYVPGNRIRRAVRHPMVLGVQLWALAHLLANTRLADFLLFGTFLIWAIMLFRHSLHHGRAEPAWMPADPPASAARDLAVLLIAIPVWGIFLLWGHALLIGVRPLGT
ncbi:MAG: NnrU family protein [Leptothrix sp. (in: b-proteobacteria)]